MIYIILIIFLILIFVFGYSKQLEVTHTTIYTDKVNEDIKIAVVGDLHSCFYGENMKELLEPLYKENVDVILNVGDMYDKRGNLKNSKKYFNGIKDYKSFYVSGNHEVYKRRDINYKKQIRSLNTVVLEGNKRMIKVKNTKLNILGVDDIQLEEIFEKQFNSVIKDNDDNFTILMIHRPHLIDLFKKSKADLVVSGHAHGGQWFIPFLNRGVTAPDQLVLPKYVNGLHKLNDKTSLYVTRGLARETVKVPRLFNKPELSILHLKKSN